MMKKMFMMIFLMIIISSAGCNKKEDTSEKQRGYQIEYDTVDENGEIYYKIGDKKYTYLSVVSGRSNNAEFDSYYIVLSNDENITFKDIDSRFWSSDVSTIADFCIVEWGLVKE